jgi:hypothetical protein
MLRGLLTIATICAALTAASSAGAARQNFFSIDSVGLGPNGFVALRNFTDTPATLRGLYLCQGMRCFALPNVKVRAATTVRVASGAGTGLKNVIARRAAIGALATHDGELAISTSKAPTSPKQLLTYLQWGSTPHRLTQLAVDAHLWLKKSYAPTAPDATLLYRRPGGLWVFKTRAG